MDQRRIHLVAAAEAARAWVHAQRATWSDRQTVNFTTVHAPALAPRGHHVETVVLPPADPSDAVLDDDSVAAVGRSNPGRPPFDVRARVGPWLEACRALTSNGVPLVRRLWRVGLAMAVVLACTGTARVYWPAWSLALRAQLAAAGAHATVFKEPTAGDAAHALDPQSPAARNVPRRTGHLQVDSFPVGARVVVDGQDRGATPLTLKSMAVGGHVVVIRGEAGEVRKTVSIAADKTTELSESIYSGWLHVSSPIELQMSESGRGIRLDDSSQVLLPPGPHEVQFENRTFGFVEVRKVDVSPGETTAVSIVPPFSKLSVTASTPAEVLLDGALIGGTPLTDYPLSLGTRELIVRNAAGLERRAMLTVTVDPVRIDVDFVKP